MCWVFLNNEVGIFKVGYWYNGNTWLTFYTFNNIEDAENKVHYLNGGN